MRAATMLLPLAFAAAAPAAAEVRRADAQGFEIESTAMLVTTPADSYAALGRIGEWWNASHSFSGDAANMRLALEAAGCFCEAIPATGGSVEHGRVIAAMPGEMLRIQTALGPLQSEPVTGILTWRLESVEGATRVTMSYTVGPIRGDVPALAAAVDQVLTEQLNRLQAHLAH